MPELKSEFLFTIKVGVSRLHDIGNTPFGLRHIDILGAGTFAGPRLEGKVLPGGMDQKIFRADGAMNPNVRLVLQTGDGAMILMYYTGIRYGTPEVMQRIADGEEVDPSEYYLRNTPYFETAAEKYDWLNHIVCIGKNKQVQGKVAYDVFRIL